MCLKLEGRCGAAIEMSQTRETSSLPIAAFIIQGSGCRIETLSYGLGGFKFHKGFEFITLNPSWSLGD